MSAKIGESFWLVRFGEIMASGLLDFLDLSHQVLDLSTDRRFTCLRRPEENYFDVVLCTHGLHLLRPGNIIVFIDFVLYN